MLTYPESTFFFDIMFSWFPHFPIIFKSRQDNYSLVQPTYMKVFEPPHHCSSSIRPNYYPLHVLPLGLTTVPSLFSKFLFSLLKPLSALGNTFYNGIPLVCDRNIKYVENFELVVPTPCQDSL